MRPTRSWILPAFPGGSGSQGCLRRLPVDPTPLKRKNNGKAFPFCKAIETQRHFPRSGEPKCGRTGSSYWYLQTPRTEHQRGSSSEFQTSPLTFIDYFYRDIPLTFPFTNFTLSRLSIKLLLLYTLAHQLLINTTFKMIHSMA